MWQNIGRSNIPSRFPEEESEKHLCDTGKLKQLQVVMHQSSGVLHWVFGGVSVGLKYHVRERKGSGIFKPCSKQQTWEIFREIAGVWFSYFTFPHSKGSEGLDDCLDFCGLLIKLKPDLWMFWSLPNTNSHEWSKEGLKSPGKLASQMCAVNAEGFRCLLLAATTAFR